MCQTDHFPQFGGYGIKEGCLVCCFNNVINILKKLEAFSIGFLQRKINPSRKNVALHFFWNLLIC